MKFIFLFQNKQFVTILVVPVATLVLDRKGAPRSSRISTTCSCPLLAPQWRGVSPSWREGQAKNVWGGEKKNQPLQIINASFGFKQHVFQKHISFSACPHLGFRINFAPSVQQQLDHVAVAPFWCHVKRCDVILKGRRKKKKWGLEYMQVFFIPYWNLITRLQY